MRKASLIAIVFAIFSTPTNAHAEEDEVLLLNLKVGMEGSLVFSSEAVPSIWEGIVGVEVPVIWHHTFLEAKISAGIWRPRSSVKERTTLWSLSGSFFGGYYPVDWFGLKIGLRGLLLQGIHKGDDVIAQLNVEGGIKLNFQSGVELSMGLSSPIKGVGYRSKEDRKILAPAVYLLMGLGVNFNIWAGD